MASSGAGPATGLPGGRGPVCLPAEIEGREGGRQGGRGPAPGSAWVKFRATQVLGESAAGVFSAIPPDIKQKENSEQEREAEEVEARARRFGDLVWRSEEGVPPPDFAVVTDDIAPHVRAELSVFLLRPFERTLKEVRVRGPRRLNILEARKDGQEMRRAAFRTAQRDSGTLLLLQAKVKELSTIQWSASELAGEDVEDSVERRLPEFTTATQAEKFKEQQQSVASLREWIYAKQETLVENFQPSGPNWSLAGQAMPVPRLPGIWYVHQRQREGGRPLPWIFFNATSGKYYRNASSSASWMQTGTPHNPETCPINVTHAVLCLPSEGGRKDDLAVALLDLPRTAQALKQPVPFIDKPSSLFLLTDGLRGSPAAAEFCAKRFHSSFLPKLSARSDALEDHEIFAIINESLESLDHALLESSARYAGCGFALALLLGRRLFVGTLGDCRALLFRPGVEQAPKLSSNSTWKPRRLAIEQPGRLSDALLSERRRLLTAHLPLDWEAARCLHSASASSEVLASKADDFERLLFRASRAAHSFAVLGLTVAATQGGIPVVRQLAADGEEILASGKASHPSSSVSIDAAIARIREAAREVESIMSMDVYVTQLVAELYYLIDEENGIPTPKRAAGMLGVEPGCGEAAVQASIDRRYRSLFTQLAAFNPDAAKRSFQILDELADAAARPLSPAIWTPVDRTAHVTRALGFRDMKRQRPLIVLELNTEVLRLEDGAHCIMLLTDGARSLKEDRLAEIATVHKFHPRAACLRIASDGAQNHPGEAVGSIAVYFNVDDGISLATAEASKATQPDPKKRKVETVAPGGKKKVRIASLLLKFAGIPEQDSHARRKAPPGRTQADAEKELLEVLEELHCEPKAGQPKDLALRFAALCNEKSDCKSALNKPHADLGWVTEGQFAKEFDAVAFDLQVGSLSDIVITPRGAQLLYRLA